MKASYLAAAIIVVFPLLITLASGRNKSALLQYMLAVLASIVVLMSGIYIVADYFTGVGIDESVFYQLQYGFVGAGVYEYAGIISVGVAILITTFLVFFLVRRLLRPTNKIVTHSWLSLLGLLLPVFVFIFHPLNINFLTIYTSSSADTTEKLTTGFNNPEFENFYKIPDLKSSSLDKKNVVYIYLEGVERTYFDENLFPGLVSGLRELESESMTFTNLTQMPGTGWTIGGMVASQCGIPLIGPGWTGNSMGKMDQFLPKATCLGDLLKDEDYYLAYMGGADLAFAGKGKFLRTHGFAEVHGKNELVPQISDPDYTSNWGLYDDTLLELAYEKFLKLSKTRNPFGLFLLTLDTHHPKGHLSAKCKTDISHFSSNPILRAVKCTDCIPSTEVGPNSLIA